jgi:hypothetical protein
LTVDGAGSQAHHLEGEVVMTGSTSTPESTTNAPDDDGDRWVFMIDPAWQPQPQPDSEEAPPPPLEVVVGVWLAGADGTTGPFRPNPYYVPSSPFSPTDPMDAVLRLISRDEADWDTVFSILRDSEFGVALDVEGDPVLAASPDDVQCLLATTAPAHRAAVQADTWRDVSASQLLALLRENEVDLLINPGAVTSTRLLAATVADAVAGGAVQPVRAPAGEPTPEPATEPSQTASATG